MSEEKRLVDVPISEQISGTYYFVVNDNGETMQVPKAEMTRYFDNGISDWSQLANKPFEDVDSTAFDVTGGILKMKKYHSHENLDVLDKFSINDKSQLLFNGEVVKSDIPEASNTVAGIVYIDDIIDANNTNNHATTTKAVSDFVSNQRTEIENNIPQADNDTIKNNNGILSADVIGNWVGGNTYNVGYFAVYNENLYECIVANSDTEWIESHWTPIGSSGGTTGTTINNWSATTDYQINDLVINETTLYQCNTEHTSGETFDETELANWTALTGARGEKGDKGDKGDNGIDGINGIDGTDGITPHIDETTNHWFIGDADTGVNATAAIDDADTSSTDVTWSASKINSVIGDINTILASVTGGVT